MLMSSMVGHDAFIKLKIVCRQVDLDLIFVSFTVPTFVSFLRDIESPFEVKDYIRMYLGKSFGRLGAFILYGL